MDLLIAVDPISLRLTRTFNGDGLLKLIYGVIYPAFSRTVNDLLLRLATT